MTTKFCLKKAQMKKNGTCSLYLRITHKRRHAYIKWCDVLPVDWNELRQEFRKSYRNSTHANHSLIEARQMAWQIFNSLRIEQEYISADVIKQLMSTSGKPISLIAYSYDWIEEKYSLAEISYNTMIKYRGIVDKLNTYAGGTLAVKSASRAYFRRYEDYLLNQVGNSTNTVTSNLKRFKTIFKELERERVIKPEDNPFLHYKLKSKQSVRKHLTQSQLSQIEEQEWEVDSDMYDAQQIFLFCAYTGMRISDVLQLRAGDVGSESIEYKCQKTKRAHVLYFVEKAGAIINRYRTRDDEYLFPFLRNYTIDVDRDRMELIKRKTALINMRLKRVGKLAGIEFPLTTHVGRHTFAVIALQKEVALEYVSDFLGHQDIRVTQHYARIVDTGRREMVRRLNR